MPKVLALDASGNIIETNISSGSGNFGSTIVDFGTGKTVASTVVTGQTSITTSNIILASIASESTVDHSADEHLVEEIVVSAGSIVNGVGFTIYARTRNVPLTGQWKINWTWG